MKTKIAICLLISFIALSSSQQKKNVIEGAWNLVSFQSIAGDTLVYKFPGDFTGSDIKIWSKGYVLYAGRFKNDTTSFDDFGGGPYKLKGKLYEETIQYFSNPTAVGENVKMLIEIRNDTLIQTWLTDENGQIDKSNYKQQKYVRLD